MWKERKQEQRGIGAWGMGDNAEKWDMQRRNKVLRVKRSTEIRGLFIGSLFLVCGSMFTSTKSTWSWVFYLARDGDSPEMEARTRGRGEEGDGSAVPAAEPVGLGVDIRGSLFLGSSTQTRLFLTFSRQLSSQNQALSEEATSSEMGVSPWHCWWKALGQPSQRIMTFPGADSCDWQPWQTVFFKEKVRY